MAKQERWGKKHIDDRDWKRVNEELVVRGEFLLNLRWVEHWDWELAKMNNVKRGHPFEFPESLIEFQAVLSQWIDCRGLEGVTRRLVMYTTLPKYNDYSTINRRINKVDTTLILPKEGLISVACDGSGMKRTNDGEYKHSMYGQGRKKYLKVIITANPHTKKLLCIEVNIEGDGPSEATAAQNHILELIRDGYTIDAFYGDGGLDAIDLWLLLEQYNIAPVIKPDRNAVDDGESVSRNSAVKFIANYGYKAWAKKRKYGMRWPGTEGEFSAVKRKFGDSTRAQKLENMCHSIKLKFWAYDRMQQYAMM